MSRTTLYQVTDGKVSKYIEFSNAWRGAAMVWDNMGKHYLGSGFDMMFSDMQKVWDLWKNPDVPDCQRIVMASTFDKVMVRAENFPRFAKAVQDYAKTFGAGHLLEQAKKLTEWHESNECMAACWQQTSVSEDIWWVEDDDDGDEWRPYDIARDSGHWFLFDEFDKMNDRAKATA